MDSNHDQTQSVVCTRVDKDMKSRWQHKMWMKKRGGFTRKEKEDKQEGGRRRRKLESSFVVESELSLLVKSCCANEASCLAEKLSCL